MDGFSHGGGNNKQLNVLGNDLEPCKLSNDRSDITTGFYRDNCCNTGPDDLGLHTVCCIMTKNFLSLYNKLYGGLNHLGLCYSSYLYKTQ